MYAPIKQALGMRHHLMGCAILLSGLIHLILTPEHLVEAPVLGLGFAVVAALQILFGGLLLVRATQSLQAVALVLAVFSLSVYLFMRLAGLPFAHSHHDGPSLLELTCKGAEVLAIGALLLSVDPGQISLPWRRARRQVRQPMYVLALIGCGLLAAVVATLVGGRLMPLAEPAHPHEHGVTVRMCGPTVRCAG